MLVFGSVLLTDSTEICLFRITGLGWSHSIFVARESQCLQWSHLAKSLGQAANFEVQLTTTTTTQQQHNFAFYAASACTWELVLGEAISLKCNLVIVLVLGSCGTLALSSASYFLIFLLLYLTTIFYSRIIFPQDKGRLSCQIATVRHPGSFRCILWQIGMERH